MHTARLTSHASCINGRYLNGPQRAAVPIEKIPFSTPFKEYSPINYTAPIVLTGPVWADKDITSPNHEMKFNNRDGKVNRASHYGSYDVVDGFPMNPVGRTGIRGRGLLGKWGPNHAADPVVTRWKRDASGQIVKDEKSQKQILEFVAIKRKDTGAWAVPGGMVDAGDTVSLTLKKEFGEEALNSIEMDEEKKSQVRKSLDELFKHGTTLYKGYVDDPRNTDNAWMETVAVNFHDNSNAFDSFKLHAGDDAGAVSWIAINSSITLYANHKQLVEAATTVNNAHW
jgi:ADP-ribose pyrophosphatase